MSKRMHDQPMALQIALANMLSIANIPREFHRKNDWLAFLSSCGAMITLMALSRLDAYPNLIYSLPNPEIPDDLQRRLVVQNPRHHARHRVHRNSHRARLHGCIYWIFAAR